MPQTLINTSFDDRLRQRMRTRDTLVCVGIDPEIDRLPAGVDRTPAGVVAFCTALVEATAEVAAAFKPNLGFFVGLGREGLDVLWQVRQAIPADVPVILDCKVGDIGTTAAAYARGWFDAFDFDAITVNPYLGEDAIAPFLADSSRGVFIICKNSNPGSGDLQDLPLADEPNEPLYLRVATRCRDWNERYPASVALVVGATYPDQLAAIRERCPDQTILVPGFGAQGGAVAGTVDQGTDQDGLGLLCSASRSIMYADSGEAYAQAAHDAARALRDEINAHRPRPNK